ncbi:hypothetical protein ACWDGI_20930 [Streptomyces sp. NPDC001220]
MFSGLYSSVAALESERTYWTGEGGLDALRLSPEGDATAVTADQLRAVVVGLVAHVATTETTR